MLQNSPHAPLCTFVIFSESPQLACTGKIVFSRQFLAFLQKKVNVSHHPQVALAKVGFSIRSTNRVIVVRAGFRAF